MNQMHEAPLLDLLLRRYRKVSRQQYSERGVADHVCKPCVNTSHKISSGDYCILMVEYLRREVGNNDSSFTRYDQETFSVDLFLRDSGRSPSAMEGLTPLLQCRGAAISGASLTLNGADHNLLPL